LSSHWVGKLSHETLFTASKSWVSSFHKRSVCILIVISWIRCWLQIFKKWTIRSRCKQFVLKN
jgi:hypothetical protein